MDGYQPPLLSLQDMLNLSDNDEEEDGIWSNTPYSISNFFEPIVTVKTENESSVVKQALSSGNEYSYFTDPSNRAPPVAVNPFADFDIHSCQDTYQVTKVNTERGTYVVVDSSTDENIRNQSKEDEFPNLDALEEACSENEEIEHHGMERVCNKDAIPRLVSNESMCAMAPQESKKRTTVTPVVIPSKTSILKETKPESTTADEIRAKYRHDAEQKHRMDAVRQLNSLITVLKYYSCELQNFLVNEGDMVLEHYDAKKLLRGILPDINESTEQKHPFYEAHSITKTLTSHYGGDAMISKLHPLRSYFWRGSDLLLLQKTILESVIHHREFLLNCRYSDLLTQMGFEAEDLERLRKCPTKEVELGAMKIILNEHDFFSKLKSSNKKRIETMVVNTESTLSGIPRVYIFPPPETLVRDKWNSVNEIRRRTVLSSISDKDIDWLYVLKKITEKNPKLNCVSEETCKLTYDHLLSFKFNNSPLHVKELEKLREIRDKYPHISWAKVAELLGTNRSAFTCFVKYKTHCLRYDNTHSNQPFSAATLNLVKQCFETCCGVVSKVDLMLSRVLKRQYPWVQPKRLFMLYQIIDPRIRKGKFSEAEDALLIVTMEKYKNYILDHDGALDPIGYALPWRHISVWRRRLETLLTKFYTKKWSLEEDRRLWDLVQEYGPNYKLIQRCFPLKDRKQCRGRYFHLLRVSETTDLDDYHVYYNLGRKNEDIDTRRLATLAKYLEIKIKSKLAGNKRYAREINLEFLKLRRKPTELNLETYMMTFPVDVMLAAMQRLTHCVSQINMRKSEIFTEDMDIGRFTTNALLKNFSRRTFDPQSPISVASALQLRNAELLPQDSVEDLTEFEEGVYLWFKYFSLRNKMKKMTKRRSIPTLDNLHKLHSICRIVHQPISNKPVHKQGQPSVVVTIKSEVLDESEKERQDMELLRQLEDNKKGGRLKGSKRKRTLVKEAKKRAAQLRWQRKTLSFGNGNDAECDNATIANENMPISRHLNIADSPYWETPSPSEPATPQSVASTTTDNESVAGTGPSMRKAMMGIISDHAYIHSIESPAELGSLSLPQLFAKMGELKGKQ